MKRHLGLLLFLLVFGSHCAYAQNGWLWGDGGKGAAHLSYVSTDKDGNCLAFGQIHCDTVHFGGYTFMDSTCNMEFFLVKIAPNGNVLWAKQVTNKAATPFPNGNAGMTTDIKGNTYCTGSFSDTIIFGPNILINYNVGPDNCSSFVAKYDQNGNVKWARQFNLISDTSVIAGNAVSTDNKGNCFVTGLFWGSVAVGGDTLYNPISRGAGTFLVKYDSNGNFKWVKQSFGNGTDYGITNDRHGNTTITGSFADTLIFGLDTLLAQSYWGGWPFTTKYDSNGNVLWVKKGVVCSHRIGGGSGGWKAVTDLSGNVYALGVFDDTVVFAPDTLINTGYQGVFLVKYDLNGNVIWVKQPEILDKNEWWPDGLSIDKYNHICFSGDGGGAGSGIYKIEFGDSTLQMTSTYLSSNALFLFKIDSNANVICGNIIQGGGDDDFSGLASDSSGNFVYISGYTTAPLIFGADTIIPSTSFSNPAVFVARWEECDANLTNSIPQNIKPTEQVNLYPNPNNGKFNIQLSVVGGQSSVVEVYNVLGEKVFTELSVDSPVSIDLSNQPAGLYLYRVIDLDGSLIGSGKFVIEK